MKLRKGMNMIIMVLTLALTTIALITMFSYFKGGLNKYKTTQDGIFDKSDTLINDLSTDVDSHAQKLIKVNGIDYLIK